MTPAPQIKRLGRPGSPWTKEEAIQCYCGLRDRIGRRPTTQELQPYLKALTRVCGGDIGNLYRWCGDELRPRGRPRKTRTDPS